MNILYLDQAFFVEIELASSISRLDPHRSSVPSSNPLGTRAKHQIQELRAF